MPTALEGLTLEAFVNRRAWKQALKHTNTVGFFLLRQFWLYTVGTGVATALFALGGHFVPQWEARVTAGDLDVFQKFMSQHEKCPSGRRWCLKSHKYVLKAGEQHKSRKRKREEFEQKAPRRSRPVKPADPNSREAYESKQRLVEYAETHHGDGRERDTSDTSDSSDSGSDSEHQ